MVEELQSQLPEHMPPESGREQICAYFEMLRVHQVPLTVETQDGIEMKGTIQSLDDAKGRFVLHVPKASPAGLEADDDIDLFFTVAGNRWVGRARIHYRGQPRDRYSVILPEQLEPCDRRRELRAMLDPLENIRGELSAAEDSHLLFRGRLSNISESGFRFSLESLHDTSLGRELDPEELTLAPGHALDHVQIVGLRSEVLETQGRIMDVSPGPLGAILGVRFRSLKSPDRLFLHEYVRNHAFTPPEVLPPLQHIPFAEEILHEINAAAEAAQALPDETEAPETQSHEEEESPTQAIPDAALRMRLKRFRSVALVMLPGLERQALQNFLAAQGFTRVLAAGTVGEVTTANKKGSLDLVLVDWQDPGATGLDIADFLLHHPFKNVPKVILASPVVSSVLAHEARIKGVLHLLVKPYALDSTLVDTMLTVLAED